MSDVTTIDTTASKDSAQQWRTALERMICHAEFGRQVVLAQFAEHETFACLTGEQWAITSDNITILNAEVYIPLPMLRPEVAWIYSGVLIEDLRGNTGIFRQCWHNSPASEACAEELRQQLEEDIKFWRQMAAEMGAEMRRTDKLIA
jgi:hypothetical protein